MNTHLTVPVFFPRYADQSLSDDSDDSSSKSSPSDVADDLFHELTLASNYPPAAELSELMEYSSLGSPDSFFGSPTSFHAPSIPSELSVPTLPSASSHHCPGSPRKRCAPSRLHRVHGSSHSRRPTLLVLPNEVLLECLGYLPASDLVTTRLVSRRLRSVSEIPLSRRTLDRLRRLSRDLARARDDRRAQERRKAPLIAHYRGFLRNGTSAELSELASAAAPGRELRTVGACLALLHGDLPDHAAASAGAPDTARAAPWPAVRRALLAPALRQWLRDLPRRVDLVPADLVDRCDRLIVAENLTYERTRAASQAAYRLLIVVAAALQVRHLSDEVGLARRGEDEAEMRREAARRFAAFLGVGAEEQCRAESTGFAEAEPAESPAEAQAPAAA